jgi:hypothetical protein
MSRRSVFEDLVKICHPYPQGPTDEEGRPTDEAAEAVHQDRQNALLALEEADLDAASQQEDRDAVLAEVEKAGEQKRDAERRLRLLLAYAREFVGPRPYPLDDLARAAQMSISGVRTGYGDAEVEEVERLTGERPWRR